MKGKSRYVWSEITEPPTPVHDRDKGVLKVIVTAIPPLRGGAMIARFAFKGHDLQIIEGEVQILQSHQGIAQKTQP